MTATAHAHAPATIPADRGPALLALARAAIDAALGGPALDLPDDPALAIPGACFVTLKQRGQLRGCIGNIVATGSLRDAVVRNAESAALRDPRFTPLRRAELAITTIELSILSPMQPVPAASEAELLAHLRPGVDGLMLRAGTRSAVFIPSVWDQLPDPKQFLDHLRAKGQFPAGRWLPDTRAERFTAEHFSETP